MEILDFVIPFVTSAINALAEVIDIRTQFEALSQPINSSLSEVLGGFYTINIWIQTAYWPQWASAEAWR
jgi:hypothetical protein